MIERLDMTMIVAWLALLTVGLVMVTSAAVAQPGGASFYLLKHGLFVAVSIGAFAVFAALPMRFWEVAHRPCLLLAFALCLLVLVPGLSASVKGATRWIDLGLARFQPAEAAKLLAVVYLAGYIARAGGALSTRLTELMRPLAWLAILLVLVLMQRDFGTTVVIAAVAGAMLFLGGARLRDFGLLALLAGMALAMAAVLEPYRLKRLQTFIDPWADPFDSGYQLTNALIGFGRGEFLGLGLGDGVQKLEYLPEAHNDFIFSVVAEELGLVGVIGLMGLLGFLTMRIFRIARSAVAEQRLFAGLVAYGAALLIGIQTVVNVGVNTGVLPTKGLTLPFISYGGNSLLVCSALVALALRVQYERPKAGSVQPRRPSMEQARPVAAPPRPLFPWKSRRSRSARGGGARGGAGISPTVGRSRR